MAARRSLLTSFSQSAQNWSRPLLAIVALSVAAPLVVPAAVARAQAEQPAPDVENARQKFGGRLIADALVYSGAESNAYPTMKLKAGTPVVVTGLKKDRLRIVPPEGSFSYAPKAFIQLYGDGKHGKVTSSLIVKAGSKLQPVKWAVQTKLEKNDDVTILGEEDEYFLIKPPEGVYLYINKDAVESTGPLQAPGGAAPGGHVQPQDHGQKVEPTGPVAGASTGSGEPAGPTTHQSAQAAAAPTTQPNTADLLTQLQALETQFAEASQKPLLEQPVNELLESYQKLAESPGLSEMSKRIADVRINTLKVRVEAKEQFAALQKQQQEFQDRLKSQQAEKQEIEQRIKEVDIQVYAAVGTLRTSSLQVAKTPLYRLTDPESGRTVVYVWATDAKVPEMVGRFVGVKGPMQTDPRLNLKVVSPTTVEAVDPAKINTSVAAQIVPPSLMPKAPTASTDGQ